MTHNAGHVPSLNTAHWRADIRFFADEVQKHHKNAFHRVSKVQLGQAVAALNARVPHLKNYEIVVGLQRLAAMIGDGQTFVATWDIFRFYPFALFWFDRDLLFSFPNEQHDVKSEERRGWGWEHGGRSGCLSPFSRLARPAHSSGSAMAFFIFLAASTGTRLVNFKLLLKWFVQHENVVCYKIGRLHVGVFCVAWV